MGSEERLLDVMNWNILLCIESFQFLWHNRLTSGKLWIFLYHYSSGYVTFKCLVLEIAVQVADFFLKSFSELYFRIWTKCPTVSKWSYNTSVFLYCIFMKQHCQNWYKVIQLWKTMEILRIRQYQIFSWVLIIYETIKDILLITMQACRSISDSHMYIN